MQTYITRQAILNKKKKVVGYEIVYNQEGRALYNQKDDEGAQAIVSFFSDMDDAEVFRDKDAYLTFTPNILMREVPLFFSADKLVIQIDGNLLLSSDFEKFLSSYKQKGFRIAITNFEFTKHFMNILHFADILKIDFSSSDEGDVLSKFTMAKNMGLKVAAFNVNTTAQREKVEDMGFDYYQGNSVAEMVRTDVVKPEHLQSNFFRLAAAVSRDEPRFDEISDIISLDATLTFALLKLVNSAYFALPNKIRSVKQALTVFGIQQIRQWVYLLSFTVSDGLSEELVKASFTRAKFCEDLVAYIPDLPLRESEAYLMGMFSLLDVLMQVPMAEALEKLSISNKIVEAILEGKGIAGDLLKLVIAHEEGNFKEVSKYCEKLNLKDELINNQYKEVVLYVGKTWSSLNKSID